MLKYLFSTIWHVNLLKKRIIFIFFSFKYFYEPYYNIRGMQLLSFGLIHVIFLNGAVLVPHPIFKCITSSIIWQRRHDTTWTSASTFKCCTCISSFQFLTGPFMITIGSSSFVLCMKWEMNEILNYSKYVILMYTSNPLNVSPSKSFSLSFHTTVKHTYMWRHFLRIKKYT